MMTTLLLANDFDFVNLAEIFVIGKYFLWFNLKRDYRIW